MKRFFVICVLILSACIGVYAQDAAAKMAEEVDKTAVDNTKASKPKYWSHAVKTSLNLGHVGLVNWAAGGFTTINLRAYFDGTLNYAKDKMTFNNRLQLDYGFLYSADKPILQKSDDRIYLESKFGYELTKQLYFSAAFNFRTQFTKGYDYKTPANLTKEDPETHEMVPVDLNDLSYRESRLAWRNARVTRSSFLAPGYTNIAFGLDYRPFKWLGVNFSPLTGGLVICTIEELREKYGVVDREKHPLPGGVKFEFGTELKVNVDVSVNEVFNYKTQVVLFANYLEAFATRVNWDNQISYKLNKYIAINLDTWLIYDPKVYIPGKHKDGTPDEYGSRKVQFKESVTIGLQYTF